MARFTWVPWGLLLVVLDLRVGVWDVLPDVVGYAWLVYALAGSETVDRGFLLARSAALAGAVSSLFTGTPLLNISPVLHVAALIVQALSFGALLFGLNSGILATAPAEPANYRRWARPLRNSAVALCVLLVVVDPAIYLVTTDSGLVRPVALLWLIARLAEAVIGILTVVLVQRVARAGWLAPGARSAETATS